MESLTDNISFYFPEKILSNADLSQKFNILETNILKQTGIRKRYISEADELASDMAVKAAERFFSEHAINKADIGFLIFCSECYDYIAPAGSCILQDRLGLNQNIGCLDLPYGCSGYVYGISVAKSLIISGMTKNVLFVTADTPTKTISDQDSGLQSIFSDAASVTYINEQNCNSMGQFVFGTDGSGWKNLYAKGSGFRKADDKDHDDIKTGNMVMDGLEIFNFGLRVVPKLVQDTLKKNALSMEDIDLFIFHQPTRFLLETLRKKLNIPEDRFFINIEEHGNTVSATIPIALRDAEKQGRLRKNMTVLLAGFGIGYSWAGTIIRT